MGILKEPWLDTGFGRRRLAFQGMFRHFGKQLIVIMIESEDSELNNFGGNEFEQFGQSFLGDFPGGWIENMNLLFAHGEGIFRRGS